MKKEIFQAIILCCLPMILFYGCTTAALNLEWQSEAVLKKPECVVHYPEENVLFVSNIDGAPAKPDGKGFISKIEMDGRIADLKWVDGLNAPKGMGISDGLLYVTDISSIVIIDISTATIVNTLDIEGAEFLNDIVIVDRNRLIVSDTKTDSIFIIENGSTVGNERRLENANGLFYDKSHVYIGANRNVYKYDLDTFSLECTLKNTGNVDGLVKKGENLFYCSNYFNKLVKYENGKPTVLLKGIPFADCVADFCMVGDKIIVPDLNNAVTMFSEQ